MSETIEPQVQRDELGRLLPGNRPPGAGFKRTTPRWDQHNSAAYKLIKEACRSEAFEVFGKLKDLTTHTNPKVQILAMEAILKFAYGRPGVATLVRAEVYRLTGQKHPYKAIQSWPDGKLKDYDTTASADLLDREPDTTLRPSISLYDPPLDPYSIAKRELEAKHKEFTKMYNELLQADANLEEMRHTVKMAKKELEAMQARFNAMTPTDPRPQPIGDPPPDPDDEDEDEDEDPEPEEECSDLVSEIR